MCGGGSAGMGSLSGEEEGRREQGRDVGEKYSFIKRYPRL